MALDGAVLVGLDGSGHADRALAWALDEARRRDAPVRLLCAYRAPSSEALDVDGVTVSALEAAAAAAERVLDRAADAAGAAGVEATAEPVQAGPAAALVTASDRAALLVVGARGRGGFGGLRLGSVSTQVTAHAACPVVVVPDRAENEARGPAPGPGSGDETDRVVVGVERTVRDGPALRAAAGEAGLRRHGLTLLGATQEVAGVLWSSALADSRTVRSREEDLRATATEVAARHPGLDVAVRVVRAPAVQALTGASRTAGLVVVGSRGRGGFTGLLLGSTSRGVLQHARCPVMVVPVGRSSS